MELLFYLWCAVLKAAARNRIMKEAGNYIKLFDDASAALFAGAVRTTARLVFI
ncbi:MAG: hypothetical protein V3W11_01175 [bacterium]